MKKLASSDLCSVRIERMKVASSSRSDIDAYPIPKRETESPLSKTIGLREVEGRKWTSLVTSAHMLSVDFDLADTRMYIYQNTHSSGYPEEIAL